MISEDAWNREGNVRCPACRERLRVAVFPAIDRPVAGALPEALDAASEASCFYHPHSRAVLPCDECGRFLCSLCELDVNGRHLCPTCFNAGVRERKIASVETRRTMYDTIALSLATFPALMLWPAVIGAPASLYYVIRYWRAPGSLAPRTRVRFYLAAFFGLSEIVGIGFLIRLLILAAKR